MQHGRETAYLRSRTGFVRVAMQEGAPLLPVFAFGQSEIYGWARPGPPLISQAAVEALSRRLGMVPLAMWGRWGSFLPRPVPMTVVVGPPIQLPHDAAPEEAEVGLGGGGRGHVHAWGMMHAPVCHLSCYVRERGG